ENSNMSKPGLNEGGPNGRLNCRVHSGPLTPVGNHFQHPPALGWVTEHVDQLLFRGQSLVFDAMSGTQRSDIDGMRSAEKSLAHRRHAGALGNFTMLQAMENSAAGIIDDHDIEVWFLFGGTDQQPI